MLCYTQSTDTTFGEKLRQQLKTHECFGYDPRIPSLDFTVRHYAGDVLYSCDKFLDKNRDTLSPGACPAPCTDLHCRGAAICYVLPCQEACLCACIACKEAS